MKKLFLIGALIFLAGCTTRPGLPYPEAFVTAEIPKYNKAWITNTGNPTATPETGIAIKLRSRATVIETRSFYEDKLTEIGWISEEEPPEGWETFYIRIFERNTEHLQLMIEDQGKDGRSITLSYQQKTTE